MDGDQHAVGFGQDQQEQLDPVLGDRSESIVPNSPWSKQSISLKSSNKVNKWLSMNTSLTYYRKDDDNLPVMGYGSSSIMYSLWCMAPNIDMNWARQYWYPG